MSPADFAAGWWRLRHRGDDAWGLLTRSGQITQLEHVQASNGSSPIHDLRNIHTAANLRVAHDRYVTSGPRRPENAQPFFLSDGAFTLGLAHNGNLPVAVVQRLRELLHKPLPVIASDSWVMTQFLLESRQKYKTWEETFVAMLPLLQGAFSLACLTDENVIYAIRDPWEIRPLCLGRKNETWVVASESVALANMGAQYVREVEPGEIVRLNPDGSSGSTLYAQADERRCVLETIYFSKNESVHDGQTIREQRRRLGELVGARFKEKKIAIDCVIPILNSGKQMSIGVSHALEMDNTEAISIATELRSFIQNTPTARTEIVNQKHVVDGGYIQGKRILLCDDSLVRGTSLSALLAKIREHNPAEIHIVLGSEPVVDICEWGIDLPTREELFVFQLLQTRPDWNNTEEYEAWLSKVEHLVAKKLGVDSVTYLDRTSVNKALKRSENQLCRHCFGGSDPIENNPPTYRVEHLEALRKQKVLFFASGSGTNVENVLQQMQDGKILAKPIGVVTNKRDGGVMDRARAFGVETTVFSAKTYELDILSFIVSHPEGIPDVIVLAGWMRILSDEFLEKIEKLGVTIVNLHPALLSGKGAGFVATAAGRVPELRGADVIEQAHQKPLAEMPVTGATVHQVLPAHKVDTGRVIIKEEVARREDETLAELTARIHKAEYRILPIAIQRILLERLKV
ncbi:MAG: hypothetical protein GW947_01225 [Candidatus Pacebacteria bacterium]|nr:hypothetical protein [Candidatus Paceibacterota bacterium]PIR60199.1 MAG: hypothetical protein COU68_02965 [Candidatus Pacebacteria bacterium CG10_big_fil_rev_8_21_14_0_10_45_6]